MSQLLKSIRDTIVLPKQVSAFEEKYIERMNRITLGFFALHVPLFILFAYLNDTGPLTALLLTSAVLIGPAIAYKRFENPRNISIMYGFTAMLMGGLLVHFGQGPVQIEMHFYFFALLAMLALFGNPMVIVTAAVTVAVHHLALWYYLPASIFNYDAPIWVVLIHATFVVVESIATVFIARSFFDNVIGLEKIVNERTKALDAKNQEMRLVLDNVDQGLLTLDADGVMSSQRSAIVGRWFGEPTANQNFVEYMRNTSPQTADNFEIAFDQLTSGFLPMDVCIDQFPKKMIQGTHHFGFSYTPITNGDELVQLLVVVSDMTAAVEREALEAESREAMQVFDQLISDRSGFLEFFEEAEELVENISSGRIKDLRTMKRVVHTLKGNTTLFGVHSIADLCHNIESHIEETQTVPTENERLQLQAQWSSMKEKLSNVLDEKTDRSIEISPKDFDHLLAEALRQAPGPLLAKLIADLKLEPTEVRLTRLSEQAKRIARRFGKGNIHVDIDAHTLRLDSKRWSPFWSAFVHVIRNAIDHGLEPADARGRAGKPEAGSLSLATRVEANEFIVSLKDDGRGIQWDAIKTRALELGIPSETRTDLEQALFCEGLSTASEVTELSGRGVGMAAIQEACKNRGGKLVVQSSEGKGTTLEFRFPRSQMAPKPGDVLSASEAA